jgi:hypothetical protein
MTTDQVPLTLVPLGRMIAVLRAPIVLSGTPGGDRMIFEVASGRLVGDRLNATITGSANADWFTIGPDGTGSLDVRVLAETDDGALVFIHYTGRTDLSANGGAPIYAAPRFDTGDDRYRWLNVVQAVGRGHLVGDTLTYDLYELR